MTYLPNDLLVQDGHREHDHIAQARSPFLDHHLMEFA